MTPRPGASLDEVEQELRGRWPEVKSQISPDAPLGVGLTLSGVASEEMLEGDRLDRFRDLLESLGLYVVTINGFAFGPVHGHAGEDNIFLPDWQDEERLGYSFRLSTILSRLLPDEIVEGGISTCPLGHRGSIDLGMPANWMVFTLNVVRVVQHLVRLREQIGKLIHLDLEPAPDGVLSTAEELAVFFERWLLTQGAAMLADRAGNDPALAREQILDHVRVCFDTCHVAVAYETPQDALDRYAEVGIKVGKVHVSNGLEVSLPEDEVGRKRISNEAESLGGIRQVAQRNRDGSMTGYPDLPEALANVRDPEAAEWRMHVHVPLFLDRYESIMTTQGTVLATLAQLQDRNIASCLEIETHVRKVTLDGDELPIETLMTRELQWVLDHVDA